jgi:hypothetical protein
LQNPIVPQSFPPVDELKDFDYKTFQERQAIAIGGHHKTVNDLIR